MNCKVCHQPIAPERAELSYSTCISCARLDDRVQRYFVPLTDEDGNVQLKLSHKPMGQLGVRFNRTVESAYDLPENDLKNDK